MVETIRLESGHTLTGIGGSNPSLSAISQDVNPLPQTTPKNVRSEQGSLAARGSSLLLSAILVLGTLLLYSPTLNNGFINYDDPAYVTRNAHVLRGLSWSNFRWALTATVEANWHPLTWISHMADIELFGLNPRGHHAISIVLHSLNVLLLFIVLRRATGFVLRSAFVAGLFAVHPLNVECVAWIAERKSLLSMLFLLLSLIAYCWYVRKRNWLRYSALILLFAMGLAAKPMIITLPLLLLLWDYWPLQRFATSERSKDRLSGFGLIIEKLPLFALSAASAWITIYAQHRGSALGNIQSLPLSWRVENAIVSYIAYLGKAIWPVHLAVFYPHPGASLSGWKVLLSTCFLIAITVATWLQRRQRRHLIVGWLWFLIAMLPMIGILQVGRQAMADRYAYLPFVGLFIIAGWSGAELFACLKLWIVPQMAIGIGVLLAYASFTVLQMHYWQNSYTLFAHALSVTNRNGIAEVNFGAALMEMGQAELALPHFKAAANYIPQLAIAHYNLGVLAQQGGHLETARREYELELEYGSDANELAQSHSNLGFLLLDTDPGGSLQQFNSALQIIPDKQNAILGRGLAEYHQHDLRAAVADFSRAARIAPLAEADYWLGRALEDQGQLQPAISAYRDALRIAPSMKEAQQRLDALSAHSP